MKTILALALLVVASGNLSAQLQSPRDSAFVIWNGFDHTNGGKAVRFTRLGDGINDLGIHNSTQTGRHIHSFAAREGDTRANFTSYGTAVWAQGVSTVPVRLVFTFDGPPNRDHAQRITLRHPIPPAWLAYEQATVIINGFQVDRSDGPAPAFSLLDIRLSTAVIEDADTLVEFEAAATVNYGRAGFLRRRGRTRMLVDCLIIVSDPQRMDQRQATIRQPDAWNKRDGNVLAEQIITANAPYDTACRNAAVGISALRVVTSKPFRCERLALAVELDSYAGMGGTFKLKPHFQFRQWAPESRKCKRKRGASEIRMDLVLMQFRTGQTKSVKFEGSINSESRGLPDDESSAEYSNRFTVSP